MLTFVVLANFLVLLTLLAAPGWLIVAEGRMLGLEPDTWPTWVTVLYVLAIMAVARAFALS